DMVCSREPPLAGRALGVLEVLLRAQRDFESDLCFSLRPVVLQALQRHMNSLPLLLKLLCVMEASDPPSSSSDSSKMDGVHFKLLYHEHKNSLTAKFNNNMTNKNKLAAWKSITEAINDLGDGGIRTVEECRKKWKDLLSRAKKDASVLKNPPTGGGPAPKTSPYSDIIIAIFGEDSPNFTGLSGIDSSELSTSTCEEVDADVSAVTISGKSLIE
ncbi:hypothetical protein JOQ06_016408, partial [Pogonophryne albipinna]